MENQTNTNNSSFTFRNDIWLLDTIINGILVIISLYLLIALIFYEVKVKNQRKQRFLHMSTENKYGMISKYVCIVIAAASLLRQSISFGRKWIEFYVVKSNLSDSQEASIETACTVLPVLGNFALTFGSGLVFIFLWFRQRIFYIHPSLKILGNRVVEYFSYSVIIIWTLFYILLYPAYFSIVRYHYDEERGCLVVETTQDPYTYIQIVWVEKSEA